MHIALLMLALTATASEPRQPAVTALALAPDGQSLLQGSQAGVSVRSLDGKELRKLPVELDHVHAIASSADGKRLAIAGGSPAEKGSVEILSWPDGKRLGKLEGHEDVVYDVVWLGDRLATAGGDRLVRIWNRSYQPEQTLQGHSGPVLALAASPDGKLLCSGSVDQTIRVWDPATGKLIRSLNNHLGTVHGLAFRPVQAPNTSPYLASVSEDGTLRVWQPVIGRLVRIVRHPAPVLCVTWTLDGNHVLSGCKDGQLRRIDADSDEILSQQKLAQGWPVTTMSSWIGTSDGSLVRLKP